MRKFLALMLLAGTCCLVFSQEARAEVETTTEVSYYEPTNSIRVCARTVATYETWIYYDVSHWGQALKDDNRLTMFWGTVYEGMDAYNEEFFPYDPNAEYSVEAYSQLITKYRHPIGDTYEDYYDYVQWTYGEPVYYPYSYGFSGPGPEVQIDFNSILLGGVFSLFTEGATAGHPHHVRVVSDSGQDEHAFCGSIVRYITLKVEDINNRRVTLGSLPIRERFYNSNPGGTELTSVYSSCTNSTFSPSPCSYREPLGRFHDTMSAGCNAYTVFPCGASEFVDSWRWCPRGQPEKDLARTTRSIQSDQVLVNGVAEYTANTRLP